MGLYSKRSDIKIGDLVILKEGLSATVYDISLSFPHAYVNWIDGPKHELKKKAIDISGPPHTWGIVKVERVAR